LKICRKIIVPAAIVLFIFLAHHAFADPFGYPTWYAGGSGTNPGPGQPWPETDVFLWDQQPFIFIDESSGGGWYYAVGVNEWIAPDGTQYTVDLSSQANSYTNRWTTGAPVYWWDIREAGVWTTHIYSLGWNCEGWVDSTFTVLPQGVTSAPLPGALILLAPSLIGLAAVRRKFGG